MGQLFEALGITPQILIAQLVNFAILLGILYYFGYQPILKFVRERTDKIADGVENANKAQQALKEAKAEYDRLVADARTEAQQIMTEAKEQARKQGEAQKEKTREELKAIAEKAKTDIAADRERMLREAKQEAVALVLQATEKLLDEKMDAEKDTVFVAKLLDQSKN